MKILIFISSLLCTISLYGNETVGCTSTIHCIYIMDTNDSRLEMVKKNMANALEKELSNMQEALGARIKKYYLTNQKFNSSDCYDVLSDMNVTKLKDIVVVMILAHGNQSANDTPYPSIRFGENDQRSYSDIMDLVMMHEPAYLFSIVNSCNHLTGSDHEGDGIYESFNNCEKTIGHLNKAAYQSLFQPLAQPLAITFLSSQKGTATLVDDRGGVPFRALMQALGHCTSNHWKSDTPLSWSDVMLTAQVLNTCNANDERTECPYVELAKGFIANGYVEYQGKGVSFCH